MGQSMLLLGLLQIPKAVIEDLQRVWKDALSPSLNAHCHRKLHLLQLDFQRCLCRQQLPCSIRHQLTLTWMALQLPCSGSHQLTVARMAVQVQARE